MINCKKHIIAACFTLTLPLVAWSEAPVVDESDNFAVYDGQQAAKPSAHRPKYDEPQFESTLDEGPPLAKEEDLPDPQISGSASTANAGSLVSTVQKLQQEIQELRGQLEVQAHEMKLLKEQQLTYYKDLDSRISGNGSAATTVKANPAVTAPKAVIAPTVAQKPVAAANAASKANPADEQISYFAAYELVKNKKYDQAIVAMQNFVQKYPQGSFTANAEYWLGELYLAQKDYKQSIAHFDIVLNQYESSSKAAACLLKSGYAYAESGNTAEARRRLQQVIANYPDTPTAQLARTKLNSIQS